MSERFKLFITAEDKAKKPPPPPLKIPAKHKGVTFDDMLDTLSNAEKSASLPTGLLGVMAFFESSGNPTAVSSESGAKGLLQITSIFQEQEKIKDVTDIKEVAGKAASFLRHAHDRMGQSPNTQAFEGFGWDLKWELAVMAYYSGVQGVLNWLGDAAPLTGDHKNVGERALKYTERISDYMVHGFNPEIMRPNWDKQGR